MKVGRTRFVRCVDYELWWSIDEADDVQASVRSVIT